jgi:phthiocerol/phenolphthiocerol synthesis type-I polyketide synthase D
LLASISAERIAPVRGIVHLWSLDAVDDGTLQSLERSQSLGSETALHLFQALARSSAVPRPRVWLITQGAQAGGAMTGLIAAHQSPLWGLGRTCSIEFPELWGGLIDLDPEGPAEDSAARLRDILYCHGDEDQLAIRGGTWLAARLVPRATMAGQRVSIHPDGSYLISGGLDGLGFRVARWAVS